MAVSTTWTNAAGGLWSVNANWSHNAPATPDTAIINLAGSGPYTVTFDETSGGHTTIADLSIGASNATLRFDPGIDLSVTDAAGLTAGTIDIVFTAGLFTGTLNSSPGSVIDDNGLLIASGSIAVGGLLENTAGDGVVLAAEVVGTGTVEAAGGALSVDGNVTGTGLHFQVSSNGASVLDLGGALTAGNTFTFLGPAGEIAFFNSNAVTANVVGQNVGASTTTPTNFFTVVGDVSVTNGNAHTGTSATIALSNGDTLHLSGVTGNTSGSWFVHSVFSGGLTEVFLAVCFAAGTHIGTPKGETVVEDLQIGDLVLTAAAAAKPIKWIGRQSYSAAAVADALQLRPVLIRKDALGAGLPRRDLSVSPMHALYLDGAFVPASALVNGVSILRCESEGPVEYIHIELHDHDVLLAEGVPAESFVDDDSRTMFDNASEYYDLYGFAETRRTFSAPRLEEGYRLEAIRRRFAARAGLAPSAGAPGEMAGHVERLRDGELEGWVMDRVNPNTPVELEVLVDGEIVATALANRYRPDLDRAGLAGGRCAFRVSMPAAAEYLAQVEVRRASDGAPVCMPAPAPVSA